LPATIKNLTHDGNSPRSPLSEPIFDTVHNLNMAHQADLHDLAVHPEEHSDLDPESQHAAVPTRSRSFFSSMLLMLLTYIINIVVCTFVVVQIMELVSFFLAPFQMIFIGGARSRVLLTSWLLWGVWGWLIAFLVLSSFIILIGWVLRLVW
jgi:ABC-type multidrug transport system permease subunit